MNSPLAGARCGVCSQFRPGRGWDNHTVCPLCRSCTRKDPCERCMSFTPAQWSEIHSWIQGQRERLQGRLDKYPYSVAVAGPSGTLVPSGSAKAKGKATSKSKGKEKTGKSTGKSTLPGGGASSSAAVANVGGTPSSEGSTSRALDSAASAPGPGSGRIRSSPGGRGWRGS